MKNSFFSDKVIIVTGARQGIGKTLCLSLAEYGAKLIINSRDAKGLRKTGDILRSKGIEVLEVPGDISEETVCKDIIDQGIKQFGRIDIVVSNAGITGYGSIETTTPLVFRKQVEINLTGSFLIAKYAIPHVRVTKGSILFISSLAGLFALPGYCGYSASKMALTAVAQCLRNEVYGQGIHIGVAYVGFTENDPDKKAYNSKGELVPLKDRFTKRVHPEKTVSLIIKQLQRRRSVSVHSLIGRVEWFVLRIWPGLINIILRKFEKGHRDLTKPESNFDILIPGRVTPKTGGAG